MQCHTKGKLPIQLAQCWFPGLAISNAKILIYLSNKCTEAILSNSTRKLLWFEITKMQTAVLRNNYRAMLCICGTSHGHVSVRLSVTSRCSTKTAKPRITQTTPYDSPGILVFWCQRSPRNSTGVTPYEGAKRSKVGQNRRLSTNNRLYLENDTR